METATFDRAVPMVEHGGGPWLSCDGKFQVSVDGWLTALNIYSFSNTRKRTLTQLSLLQ